MSKEEEFVIVSKKKINKKRLEVNEIIADAKPLGLETVAVLPEDIEVMYAGKMCDLLLKNGVRATNIKKAFMRSYPSIDPEMKDRMELEYKEVTEAFAKAKKRLSKIGNNHPLWKKFEDIKGFTSYQLALIMCYMKDPRRFDTASKLMIYSGIGCIEGLPVTKANILKIKDIYFKRNKTGVDGKLIEFAGFNTVFSGRMFVIVDCLLRSRGWFLNFYTGIRKRLEERAVNGGEVEMIEGKLYMKNKNKQSLILWSSQNAKRRVARTLLHMIHTEWLALYGITARIPYPIDYLGHKSLITLDQVLNYDRAVINTNKKKSDLPPEISPNEDQDFQDDFDAEESL